MIRVSVTGHRELFHDSSEIESSFLKYILSFNDNIVVNTGMALGFDLLVAETCLRNNIPYNAILPFEDHLKTNELFQILKEGAKQVIIVNSGPFEIWKYFSRDKWLVDNAEHLYAYLIKQGKSGTKATVGYAVKKSIPIKYFNSKELDE